MEKLLPMLRAWMDAGLMGLEVYHPANKEQFVLYDRLARQNHLLVTGGSDYHGQVKTVTLGQGLDAWRTKEEDVRALLRALGD